MEWLDSLVNNGLNIYTTIEGTKAEKQAQASNNTTLDNLAQSIAEQNKKNSPLTFIIAGGVVLLVVFLLFGRKRRR